MKRLSLLSLGILLLASGASGWKTVRPGEVVVVRRFGKPLGNPWGPGAHWAWPLGIDRLSRLRLDEVRWLEFGRVEPVGPQEAPGFGEFLTGDRNLIRARGVVQYRVADPLAFVLRANDFDAILTRLTEASLARSLASRPIDDPLRDGRAAVARDVEQELARSVGALGLGISILSVNLTDARPPIEVEPAFTEAQSAQSERDQRIHEARSLAGRLRPVARASATSLTEEAKTESTRKVTLALAEADRFTKMLVEVNRSRALTITSLYRDALRDLLPRIRRKVLMTGEEAVDLGLIGKE